MSNTEIDHNYMKIMRGIMDLLKDHDRPVVPELPRFEKEFADKKIELHYSHYFIWRQIITVHGIELDRILDTISYFVKLKNFKYDAKNAPENMVYTLATSTYLLRDSAFNPSAYKYDINSSEIVKDHEKLNIAKYYDIGVTLIKKGFNFGLSLDHIDNATAPYANFYLKQCLKRKAYLNKVQR